MSTSSQRSLPRKYSDISDKERPFVAVRRAHESAKQSETLVGIVLLVTVFIQEDLCLYSLLRLIILL